MIEYYKIKNLDNFSSSWVHKKSFDKRFVGDFNLINNQIKKETKCNIFT